MTQPTAQPEQRYPAVQTRAAGEGLANLSDAARVLDQRTFLLVRAVYAHAVPPHLVNTSCGLGLCGDDADLRAARLGADKGLLRLTDPATYEKFLASVAEPMLVPDDDQIMLFGGGLDGLLSDQIDRGAALAMPPMGHVQAGDSDALKAVMRAAQGIERRDVLMPVSVDVAWLRDESVDQLAAVLERIPHPKALILCSQYNATDRYVAAPRNLRQLYSRVSDVGLWRTDPVSGLDCLAHGGLFAGIGATGSLRHVVPPGEKAQFGAKRRTPHVFIPDLMSYYTASKLARLYANTAPLPCLCPVCDGRALDRFDDTDAETHQAAEAHNLAAWSMIADQLLAHVDPTDRQLWWDRRCQMAMQAHDLENVRIEQPRALKPSKTLEGLVKLQVLPGRR